jgi:UDPglucose--hexose-1-phosphate uridylyltransferase
MSLAVLPARLEIELKEVENYLLSVPNSINPIHIPWAEEIKRAYEVNKENVHDLVKHEVGKKFMRVLKDAGVFKRDETGKAAFPRFVDHLTGVTI